MPALRKTNDGLRREPTLTNEGWRTRTSEKQIPRALALRMKTRNMGGVGHGKTRTLETEGCGTRKKQREDDDRAGRMPALR